MTFSRSALLALALCLASSAAGLASQVSLKTMAFNIRYAGTVDDVIGSNGWYALGSAQRRAARVVQVIRDYGPDILGTQEALDFQYTDLTGATYAEGLAEYDSYGVGRDDGQNAGEYAAIFYRADRFSRLDAGTFWLSPTPDVPGSQYPGAGTVRIASWVRLEDHLSGREIFVLNTHFDNVSSSANLYSANLIRQRLPGLAGDAPILVTGDFNSSASSSIVRTLMGEFDPGGLQLADSYREVHPTVQSNEKTYHAYAGGSSGSRIDFIFSSDELLPVDAAIVRTSYNGKFPSDHYPVTVDFMIAVVPEPASWVLVSLGLSVLYGIVARSRKYKARLN